MRERILKRLEELSYKFTKIREVAREAGKTSLEQQPEGSEEAQRQVKGVYEETSKR